MEMCVQHTKIDKQRRTTNTLKKPVHSIMEDIQLIASVYGYLMFKILLPLYSKLLQHNNKQKNIIEDPVAATHFSLMQHDFSCIVTS